MISSEIIVLFQWFALLVAAKASGFETQTYRTSGLNLLVAAIILRNTRYLERAVGALSIPEYIARHIVPLGWEHLSLTLDYR